MVDADTVIQLYTAGDSTSTVARRLSIGRSTVTQTLREAGVQLRPRTWRGPAANHLADDLAWMDEDRPRAEERGDGCCAAFRRGVVAASIGDARICVRCAAERRKGGRA
jgi:hypothetical protein